VIFQPNPWVQWEIEGSFVLPGRNVWTIDFWKMGFLPENFGVTFWTVNGF
jgi:hypothetical protein